MPSDWNREELWLWHYYCKPADACAFQIREFLRIDQEDGVYCLLRPDGSDLRANYFLQHVKINLGDYTFGGRPLEAILSSWGVGDLNNVPCAFMLDDLVDLIFKQLWLEK